MKHLLTTLLLLSTLACLAQKKDSVTLLSALSQYTIAGTGTISYSNPKDTIPCYFRELTGIVKSNLMGRWVKGWAVVPKGSKDRGFISYGTGYEKTTYLYPNKKPVTNIIIQTYY